ncbi:MAG: hypothetical protein RLZ29_255 [Actinomycetota bacterium]
MANFSPFPQTPLRLAWTAADGGESSLEVRFENEGWTVQGSLGTDDAQFVMRLSATLVVQQFMLFRDMDEPDLWLGRDRSGRWGEINGAHRPDLDGCTDIELQKNPFPTSATMKRLPLHDMHAASITVASVDVETLQVVPRQRTFTRLTADRWRYSSPFHGREVESALDEHGIIIDESEAFVRRMM